MKQYDEITVNELQNLLDSTSRDKSYLYKRYTEEYSENNKFKKDAIISSDKYRTEVDLLTVKLKDDRLYSTMEIDGILREFKNKEIGGSK